MNQGTFSDYHWPDQEGYSLRMVGGGGNAIAADCFGIFTACQRNGLTNDHTYQYCSSRLSKN